MRPSSVLSVRLLIVLAVANPALADDRPPKGELGPAAASGGADGPASFPLRDFGIRPGPVPKMALVRLEPIREELKLSAAQKEALTPSKILGRFQERLREAASIEDREERKAAIDGVQVEIEAAVSESLDPPQRERLDQIQLQLQGPEAFLRPDVQAQLGLSADQIHEVRPIVDEGREAIIKAATVPIPTGLRYEDRPGAFEDLVERVDTPEFREAIQRARREARAAWEKSLGRIARVLTDPQRKLYQQRLGAPFDATRLKGGDYERRAAVGTLAARVGATGQRPDPDFDVTVAHPAYAKTHPKVLFDEAHHNFHTAGGRYKPFADLIANDGYLVIPNHAKFSRPVLDQGDILVVANALGGGGIGSPEASNAAFTDDECEAVREWVQGGGALLLISDHPPMGSAAASLAKRFGVGMSEGVALDPKNSDRGPSQLVFSKENKLLGDHPITRGRDESESVGRVMTFTGQALEGPEGSASFLTLGSTATDAGRPGTPPVSIAGRSQGLALRYGKGRVVVLGEAGQLSAQILGLGRTPIGMNVPGIDNRRLALNIMHWLSGLTDP